MGSFAALGAKITIDGFQGQAWPDALKIGPITFVGGISAAALAVAIFNRCVIGGRRVPDDLNHLLPFWWLCLMQIALVASVLCLLAGFIGDAFQATT